jgi:ABC-type amino acid transport system permease subunit
MAAAATIFNASPIRKGYMPTARALGHGIPVRVLSQVRPQAYKMMVPPIMAAISKLKRDAPLVEMYPIIKTAGR